MGILWSSLDNGEYQINAGVLYVLIPATTVHPIHFPSFGVVYAAIANIK